MPLVRISHTANKLPGYSTLLSQGVHRALIDVFGIPSDDYFHVLTEHTPEIGIFGPSAFLGITHTTNLVFVQITCSTGRTLEKKKTLYQHIATNLATEAGVRQEDVIINLVETRREDWSFGNGIAQYVP
jgi:4-oxalocrotonate tautomerase